MSAPTRFHAISAFRASDVNVVAGANEGDDLGLCCDLVMDDIIMLRPSAEPETLWLLQDANGALRLRRESAITAPPAGMRIDGLLTFMGSDGSVAEVLLLDQRGTAGGDGLAFVWPLSPLQQKTEYQLIAIDQNGGTQRLAQMACTSFARGTRITMGSGRQRAVETLASGDEVLTRDDGVQSLCWTGQSTARASGAFAPVRIAAGTVNNRRDLLVSPDHRLFLYQQTGVLGPDRSGQLVRARDLVNGRNVTIQEGGFVDYVQLLFERPQIIYAEGIATETMVVDGWPATPVSPDLANGRDLFTRPRHGGENAIPPRSGAAPVLRRVAGR